LADWPILVTESAETKQMGSFPEQAYAHLMIANGRLYICDLGT